jgi:hypothetical protein
MAALKNIDWKRGTIELLIIVVGVLLALAMDRWQQSQNQDEMAVTYVDRLIADLDTDLAAYQNTTQWSVVVDEAAAFVVEVYRGREVLPTEYEHFVLAILKASWLQKGGDSSATYTDLISTGNLALLSIEDREQLSKYYSLKKSYLEIRNMMFIEKLSHNYWNMPSLLLGPDLVPQVWLSVQGRAVDYLPSPGSLNLSGSEIEAIVERLRGVEDLEKLAADVRLFMTQRKVIYGERLPNAARHLKSVLMESG